MTATDEHTDAAEGQPEPQPETDKYHVTPEHAAHEVGLDLANAVRGYYARAADADRGADDFAASAEQNRHLAAEYRAKADVLKRHMATLGIPVE